MSVRHPKHTLITITARSDLPKFIICTHWCTQGGTSKLEQKRQVSLSTQFMHVETQHSKGRKKQRAPFLFKFDLSLLFSLHHPTSRTEPSLPSCQVILKNRDRATSEHSAKLQCLFPQSTPSYHRRYKLIIRTRYTVCTIRLDIHLAASLMCSDLTPSGHTERGTTIHACTTLVTQ